MRRVVSGLLLLIALAVALGADQAGLIRAAVAQEVTQDVTTGGATGPAATSTASETPPAAPSETTEAKPKRKKPDWLTRTFNYFYNLGARFWSSLLILVGLGFLMRRFMRTELFARLTQTLTEDVLTNWRLLLLGLTGIVLSLASGYTTWDGMTNFTCPARSAGDLCTGPMLLSLMITFGIQGVMLIAAWLIGESFAQGLGGEGARERSGRGPGADLAGWVITAVLVLAGLVVAVIIGVLVLSPLFSSTASFDAATGIAGYVASHWEALWYVVLAAVAIGALIFMLSEREIIGPYLRGLRIVLKNLPIWLMFLACMATSVFFSFDSLFSTIFPADERARAASIRTTNQVSGLIADLNATMARRQAEEIDGLFRSEGWADYNARLEAISEIARSAPGEIEAMRTAELNARQSTRASLQEKKATAASQLTGLEKRKVELIEIKTQLNAEVPPIAAEVERVKAEIFRKDSEIVAKKAEADAERGGVGGTLKAGAGPEFAKRRKELADLATLKSILQAQLKEFEAQLKAKRDGSASAEAELAQIDGQIGKLKGEMQVADQQMDLGATVQASADAPTADVTAGFASLDSALAEFRQRPERATFEAIQQHCMVMLGVFDRVPNLKAAAETRGVGCDPVVVAESTGRIFAITEGLAAFKSGCAKGENLPLGDTDALIEFGGRCIQNSGLAGADTQRFRLLLNRVSLNRDDKAHRFVVTWNAFLDGNQLAYLALAIALAIDGLVFMSGLFGANAVRSPLTDAPHGRARSASQLEAIINNALGEDRFGTAGIVLSAMKPITLERGFSAEIDLRDVAPSVETRVIDVLNAGAILGTVERDEMDTGRYLIRAELLEYLHGLRDRERRTNKTAREVSEREEKASSRTMEIQQQAQRLAPMLEAALLPNSLENIALITRAMRPISDPVKHEGFASEIEYPAADFSQSENDRILAVLNAGSTFGTVVRGTSTGTGVIYLVKPELNFVLSHMKRYLLDPGNKSAIPMFMRTVGPNEARNGAAPQLANESQPRRIAHQRNIANDQDETPQPFAGGDDHAGSGRYRKESWEHFSRELGFELSELESMRPLRQDSLRQLDMWSKRSEREASRVQELRQELRDRIELAATELKRRFGQERDPEINRVTRDVLQLIPGMVCERMLKEYQAYEGEQLPQA